MTYRIGALASVHGEPVGTLWRVDDDENHLFTFEPSWLGNSRRPILGQLFEDWRPRPLQTSGLPNWFAHLLPQGAWARHLRRWAGLADDASDLELLLSAADLPGALALDPLQGDVFGAPRPTRSPAAPAGALRFTLAGAQWKLSVRRGERGLVVPVVGQDGEFIAKFHDPEHPDLPRVEHATLAWARASGIVVPDARLAAVSEFEDVPRELPTGDGHVLLVRRFDRSDQGPVHFEELAQVADRVPGDVPGGQYQGSYEEMAALVGALCPSDAAAFLDRLVFTVLSGDGDAHWKNWALIYPDRRRARLAPAYDLVPTVLFPSVLDQLALTIGGRRAFTEVDPREWTELPRLLGRESTWVSDHVADAIHRVRAAFAVTRGGYTSAQSARLKQHLDRLTLP